MNCHILYLSKLFLSLMSKNSVLEEFRVKKICGHPRRDLLKRILKVSNA